ncbi:hypothetical protein SF83666_b49160 (plasmid) [Sinorhizobium fredii CCBAU 83666]|nr:hypothetical protein SF83666_b49160 [Sinorhizobium fredii CCBAU 83666]
MAMLQEGVQEKCRAEAGSDHDNIEMLSGDLSGSNMQDQLTSLS